MGVIKGGKMKARENLVGAWAFLIGVILAIIIGLLPALKVTLSTAANSTILALLVILGIIVGLLNVTNRDSGTFLLAAVSLVIVSFAGVSGLSDATILQIPLGTIVKDLMGALLVLFTPAAIIVALKTVFAVSKA